MKSPVAVCPPDGPRWFAAARAAAKHCSRCSFWCMAHPNVASRASLWRFEETAEELAENVASLGFDLKALIARNLLLIDHVQIERYEFEETGEYNLDGLFLRLGDAIDTIKAKRVVLDTIEVLFTRISNQAIVRESLHGSFAGSRKRALRSS